MGGRSLRWCVLLQVIFERKVLVPNVINACIELSVDSDEKTLYMFSFCWLADPVIQMSGRRKRIRKGFKRCVV